MIAFILTIIVNKEEFKVNVPGFSSSAMLIFMKGGIIMYAKHHSEASQTIY
jgi:hypothetical protein